MPSRRRVLGYLGAASAGAVAGGGAGVAAQARLDQDPAGGTAAYGVTGQAISPYGEHQAGIVEPTPRATELVAFTLRPGTDVAALGRLMRLWTADIAALTSGRAAPGDTARDLAQANVSLTITVGFGPAVFRLPGLAAHRPAGFVDVPAMKHDRLQPAWTGGDLVVIVAADDSTTVAHALRRLVSDAEPFAVPRWAQRGSWRSTGTDGRPVTGRNLFGQVDGSGNPRGAELAATVWADGPDTPDWFRGGTTLVVRRIRMNLDTWDELTRSEQERAVGRRLDTGAPLTGTAETDELDLTAKEAEGRPRIALDAHARISHHSQNAGRRILRKGLNYTTEGVPAESGLVFLSYQADLAGQFVPLQVRLDQGDSLNEWTTAIGSAVFAVPPGFDESGWIGRPLLS